MKMPSFKIENFVNYFRSDMVCNSSLGSKELFHSNMLGMFLMLENTTEEKLQKKLSIELAKLFLPKTKSNKTYQVVSVFREWNKFDLFIAFLEKETYEELKKDEEGKYLLDSLYEAKESLSFKELSKAVETEFDETTLKDKIKKFGEHCRFVVVENKFKSIPNQEQLEEYSGKVAKAKGIDFITGVGKKEWNVTVSKDNTTFYLLAPEYSIDVFKESQKINKPKKPENIKWNTISYEKICEELEQILTENKTENEFAYQYVERYKNLIEQLSGLIENEIKDPIEADEVFPKKEVKNKLASIRLQDLYEKIWYNALVTKLRKPCVENNKLKNTREVISESGYGHQSGLMGYKCYLKDNVAENVVYGIQIQSGQFRFYVEPNPKKKDNKTEYKWKNFDKNEFLKILCSVRNDTLQDSALPKALRDKILAENCNECSKKEKPVSCVKNECGFLNSTNQKLNKFGDFKYVSIKLPEDIKKGQLIKLIEIALKNLESAVEKIKVFLKL
ncbi:MAG: PD-(D/E)XK nuclease family protein [Fibrobacteraceae bacterium]|nr:PD-(D/E)XK nuclease family protein [Fibrobacteraceae bacterium]